MPYLRSIPASASLPLSGVARPAPLAREVRAKGLIVRLRPAGSLPSPLIVPAAETRKIRLRRSSGAQYDTSFLRRTRRKKLSPHV
jgi:hypothetical protein